MIFAQLRAILLGLPLQELAGYLKNSFASDRRAENYALLRHWQVSKACTVLHLPGRTLGARGYIFLQGLITRVFPR